MFYLFTFLTLLLSFLRNNVVYCNSDELMTSMIKAAHEHGLVSNGVATNTITRPSPALRLRTLKGKDKPKPDPKPKPPPPQYMVFTNHIDDSTCGERSLIESHGYLIGYCFPGSGDLTGLYWAFTTTTDATNINLNYGFYTDSECTNAVLTSTEVVPSGCAARGVAGGHQRNKNFVISSSIPNYKGGALFNGYATEASCKRESRSDSLVWSFLKNDACDPQISSPVYGEHVTDETRTCKKGKIVANLYDSNDLTCSGAVTTTTKVDKDWECIDDTVTGVDSAFVNPKCV